MKFWKLYLVVFSICCFSSCGGINSFRKEQSKIRINKSYIKKEMVSSSLTVLFSRGCGYSLLLNEFLKKKQICEKYGITLTILDVTYLDLPDAKGKLEEWGSYPECSESKVLLENKYKFQKLRPILFFKDYTGKVTKVMGFNKDKLASLLKTETKKFQ